MYKKKSKKRKEKAKKFFFTLKEARPTFLKYVWKMKIEPNRHSFIQQKKFQL